MILYQLYNYEWPISKFKMHNPLVSKECITVYILHVSHNNSNDKIKNAFLAKNINSTFVSALQPNI